MLVYLQNVDLVSQRVFLTHFNYELLPHRKIGAELVTKRNYHWLNSHNRVMLENWRANVDLQVIVDKNACARYIGKYAAKG